MEAAIQKEALKTGTHKNFENVIKKSVKINCKRDIFPSKDADCCPATLLNRKTSSTTGISQGRR